MTGPQYNLLAFFDPDEPLPPFVDPVRADFFALEQTSNQAFDNARGVQAAVEALTYARRHRNPALIALALMAIAEKRRQPDHLEAGFIVRVSSAALAGAMD